MGRRSFVSFGLFILPVAVTISVLIGLESYRTARGLQPLFVNNHLKTDTYCQVAFGISPDTSGQQYTLNPNQWGLIPGQSGALCMNVTAYGNGSYPSNITAPEWSITWQFPPGPATAPVHAFPNIKIDSDGVFPVSIDQVQAVNVNVSWLYSLGDMPASVLDVAALATVSLAANVAVDMFVDPDGGKAASTIDAKYEVMVWLGAFGAYTDPIGLDQGVLATEVIDGTTFNLYFGVNSLGQTVCTWVATVPTTTFLGDVSPLLNSLSTHGGPAVTDQLGYVAFGSETLNAAQNVTLSVPNLSLEVVKT